MDVPLRRPGDVHACRLRHVGDRMLPCQECLQRLDEEPGERVSEGARCGRKLSETRGTVCFLPESGMVQQLLKLVSSFV